MQKMPVYFPVMKAIKMQGVCLEDHLQKQSITEKRQDPSFQKY